VVPKEAAEGFAMAPTLGYEERLRSVKDLARQEPKVVANVVKDWIGQ
jgi:flagellar M-ring protein FliF